MAVLRHCSEESAKVCRRRTPSVADVALSEVAAKMEQGAAPAAAMAPLANLAECFQPIFLEVAAYAASLPCEYAALCELSSRSIRAQAQPHKAAAWADMYASRWPAFFEALSCRGPQDWLERYRETVDGKLEVVLEIFEREKKVGFAMSAMTARVQYESIGDMYIARYLSASEVLPEGIPASEEHRLRFCPESARAALRPCAAEDGDMYAYRVLEGVHDLEVGEGVELQWKMQAGSPFGWWYGHLEALRRVDAEGQVMEATVTFQHFPATSRWYRLVIRFGDGDTRPCAFGGFTGGVRAVSTAERRRWMRYFPTRPVTFSQDAA